MAWTDALLNIAVDAAAAEVPYVSGFDSDVAEDEVTSRESVTWGAADGGACFASNQPVLEVAGACTITHIFLWASAEAENELASFELETPVEFTGAGTYTLTVMVLGLS